MLMTINALIKPKKNMHQTHQRVGERIDDNDGRDDGKDDDDDAVDKFGGTANVELIQSVYEVPLIMSSKRNACESGLMLLLALSVTETLGLTREFVTLRNLSAALIAEEQASSRMHRRLHELPKTRPAYQPYYQLRFQPAWQLPRLFWHKLPQQEEPTEPAPTMPTAAPTPQPTVPTATENEPTMPMPTMPMMMMTDPPPPVNTTELPMTMPPAPMTISPPTMLPTREPNMTDMPIPPKPTKRPPLKVTTTRTAIMRPTTQTYPPQFGNTLKQLLLFGSPIEANLIQKKGNAVKSKGKGFLSLFEVIKFPNSKCSVAMGDIRSMEGVCYHEFECKSLGGIPTESCADGVGVCCIFLTGCGNTSSQSVVYFESPNYPNAVREMMICVLIITVRKNVQQLRLDFLMFELNRPTDGDCVDDQFIVSGHNPNFQVPILCGINTGQHMYIHVGNSFENKIYLSVFVKVSTGGRSFNIKITQLEDDLAPDNCLQYFTETEGLLKSFNYDIDGTIVENKVATYFNNLNYVMCMARAKNTCSVTYTTEQLGDNQADFQIINKDEAENDLVPDGQAGAGIFNCPDDFISINSVRLCGERLNDGTENEDFTVHAPIRDTAAGPIMLPFRTDAEYVGRGFRLLYKQEACG